MLLRCSQLAQLLLCLVLVLVCMVVCCDSYLYSLFTRRRLAVAPHTLSTHQTHSHSHIHAQHQRRSPLLYKRLLPTQDVMIWKLAGAHGKGKAMDMDIEIEDNDAEEADDEEDEGGSLDSLPEPSREEVEAVDLEFDISGELSDDNLDKIANTLAEIDRSNQVNVIGKSLSEAAKESVTSAELDEESLWLKLQNRASLQGLENKIDGEVEPISSLLNATTLLYRDGVFVRPLPDCPPLTEDQKEFINQFKVTSQNSVLAESGPGSGRGRRRSTYKPVSMKQEMYLYPNMLIHTSINSTIKLPERRKGYRILDVLELKALISLVTENKVIEVIEDKVANKTYLPMDDAIELREKSSLGMPPDNNDTVTSELIVRLGDGSQHDSVVNMLKSYKDAYTGSDTISPLPRQEEVNEHEYAAFEQHNNTFSDIVLEPSIEDSYSLDEQLGDESGQNQKGRKGHNKELPADYPFPSMMDIEMDSQIVKLYGENASHLADKNRTLSERIDYMDQRSRIHMLEYLQKTPTTAIIIEQDNEPLPSVSLYSKLMTFTENVKVPESVQRVLEARPPRERIYVSQSELDKWRATITNEYKDVKKKYAQMEKLKTTKGRSKRNTEILDILSTRFELDVSLVLGDVTIDEIRDSLNHLTQNVTVTDDWIRRFEALAEKLENEGEESLTEEDELAIYVLERATRSLNRDANLILTRQYLDKNLTEQSELSVKQMYFPLEYSSRKDARNPTVVASKLIEREMNRTGKAQHELSPLPWSIPYDQYFQGSIVDVYAAVCNTSTNTSMVGVAERLLVHIDTAMNFSQRIKYHILIFGDEAQETILPEYSDLIQVWVEGHSVFHLVDGVAMKEIWGGIPEHIIFSPKNLELIVNQVQKAAVETELGGPILSPYETKMQFGKPDESSILPMTTPLNFQNLPKRFSTVNGEI